MHSAARTSLPLLMLPIQALPRMVNNLYSYARTSARITTNHDKVEGIDDRGQFVYKDLNDDGVVNEEDRRFFGSFIPSFTSSLNFKINYKNFDFNLDTYGSFGNKVYNGKKAQRFGNENIEQYVFNNRWTTGRPSSTTPRASNNVPLSSDYF